MRQSGVGFFGLLFIVFLVLKLTAVIDWSWWYVAMPLYLPVAVGLLFIPVFLFFAIVAAALSEEPRRRR